MIDLLNPKALSQYDAIITKIMYLVRIIEASEYNVILLSDNKSTKFIVFIACLLAKRTLFIAKDKLEAYNIISKEEIGTVFSTKKDLIYSKYELHYSEIDIYAFIENTELVTNRATFNFFRIIAVSKKNRYIYTELQTQSFKVELQPFCDMWRYSLSTYNSDVIKINCGTSFITYDKSNILHMLNTIDTEFESDKVRYIDTRNVPFEKIFVYLLYFFIKGDLIDVMPHNQVVSNLLKDVKGKDILCFLDNNSFDKKWHTHYKYIFYSKLNSFLSRFWITRWITIITYYLATVRIEDIPVKEYIIINLEHLLDRATFLDRNPFKFSSIYGTYADAFTLSINRYNDKETNFKNNSYRIMDKNSSIKISTDSINRLYLGGNRIHKDYKQNYVYNSKSKKDLYYFHDVYCKLKGEILSITADCIDLYFNEDGTIVDIGTKRKSLLNIPYVVKAEVLKLQGEFKAVVSVDPTFVVRMFEKPTLSSVLAHLYKAANKINDEFESLDEIKSIVVHRKFFIMTEIATSFITKKNYYEYLNQQPSNYLERFEQDQIGSK